MDKRNHPGFPSPRMRPTKYLRAVKAWHQLLAGKRAKNAAKMHLVASATMRARAA